MLSNLFESTDKVSEASRSVKCEMLKLANGANTAAGSDTVHKKTSLGRDERSRLTVTFKSKRSDVLLYLWRLQYRPEGPRAGGQVMA